MGMHKDTTFYKLPCVLCGTHQWLPLLNFLKDFIISGTPVNWLGALMPKSDSLGSKPNFAIYWLWGWGVGGERWILSNWLLIVWKVQTLQGRLQAGDPGKNWSSSPKIVCWQNFPFFPGDLSFCIKVFNCRFRSTHIIEGNLLTQSLLT